MRPSWSSSSANRSPHGRRRRRATGHVDLHTHSTASDGELPPEAVAARAREAGLAAIALTDHDTLDGVAAAQAAGDRLGVRVVAGCEFSVLAPWGEAHILGYFLSTADAALQRFLDQSRQDRRERAGKIVQRLQALGVGVAVEDVLIEAGSGAVAIGRPHVARALRRRGVVQDVGEAFTRFIGRGKPAFVEKPLPTFAAVAGLVHDGGGLVVAAHLADHGTEPHVRAFAEQGLDGLEVRHPAHDRNTEGRLTALAQKLKLALTGGSDWHGDAAWRSDRAPLGGLKVPEEWLQTLEERR